MTIKNSPEFLRAQLLIQDAVSAADGNDRDLPKLAACLLAQSSALYALLHGTEGPDGLSETLKNLSDSYTSKAERIAAQQRFGMVGRA